MGVQSKTRTLGEVIREIRSRNSWTLKEMSEKSGIPVSTLSKVEHNRLTLSYDKLQQLSQRLNIRMSDLFAEAEPDNAPPRVTGRRSIGRLEEAVRVTTENYDYYYLCTDLRQKRMIPIVTRIRAQSAKEFGELVHHHGEEFIYVVEGGIEVHSEFYDPVRINAGEGIYLDSSMGHAYVTAEGCEEAVVLGVCSSEDDGLMDSLLNLRE
ncbi:helix-turn-helix domain-containing protein [Altererythrobacter sp. SALINAS58]|uniref:helix-turn-helix domain-containing protein n=1 Tax=Alteripontixanthobacter muriae TaxID=2705546 RepID=UPI001575B2B1|nr:XRE family transcriptional regulator [Alteripontixanthobacter muriae]NTZ43276.1 helix-turn-helix domain-containing protein [Alteripontixanthobacter muriae]